MNAPKASAQKWKLARKFELYWEQTVLVSVFSDPLLSFGFLSIIPETVFFSLCLEGMSISFLLSPPLTHFLSYSCNLLLAFWGSALLTALGTKCCPPFSCRQEGVTCAIPNFPPPVSVFIWSLPSLVIRLCFSIPPAFCCCLWIVAWLPGGKRKYVIGFCCLWGEKLFKLRQPYGLQDFSWPGMANFVGWDRYSRSHLSYSFLF